MGGHKARHKARPYKTLPQRLPLQQLHHDEGLPLVLLYLVNAANVRTQGGGGASFAFEAFQRLSIVGQLLRKKLQRHLAAQANIFRPIDHTHAALARPRSEAPVPLPGLLW